MERTFRFAHFLGVYGNPAQGMLSDTSSFDYRLITLAGEGLFLSEMAGAFRRLLADRRNANNSWYWDEVGRGFASLLAGEPDSFKPFFQEVAKPFFDPECPDHYAPSTAMGIIYGLFRAGVVLDGHRFFFTSQEKNEHFDSALIEAILALLKTQFPLSQGREYRPTFTVEQLRQHEIPSFKPYTEFGRSIREWVRGKNLRTAGRLAIYTERWQRAQGMYSDLHAVLKPLEHLTPQQRDPGVQYSACAALVMHHLQYALLADLDLQRRGEILNQAKAPWYGTRLLPAEEMERMGD